MAELEGGTLGMRCPTLEILIRKDAPQRKHSLSELFNGLRNIAPTGLQWRFMPTDLSPRPAVYQQTRR